MQVLQKLSANIYIHGKKNVKKLNDKKKNVNNKELGFEKCTIFFFFFET